MVKTRQVLQEEYLSNRAPCLRGLERNYACVRLVPAVVGVGRPQIEVLLLLAVRLVVVVVDGAARAAGARRRRGGGLVAAALAQRVASAQRVDAVAVRLPRAEIKAGTGLNQSTWRTATDYAPAANCTQTRRLEYGRVPSPRPLRASLLKLGKPVT